MSENPNLAGGYSGSNPNNPPTFAAPNSGYTQAPYGAPAYGGQPNQFSQPPAIGLRSRLVAGLLGIFLGGLGIHRFYLGYTSIGIIQIVVSIFTLGLGSLWGFIEGIMILARANSFQHDANGRPLAD
ncbi:MAG: TM2 domain-containing protein [Actinomycetaceae bacterium]|nr:TM2 domain-containing protein [Arcanobacterium sp.]MDD7686954.1 TM2 domain-containing protein [Actinomycetaceae bacterium]MDY5273391.1 TM2 domain-containing protein [Arcanobacterium sp.]